MNKTRRKIQELHRIPYDQWANSQLSVARFSGGCTLNGKHYEFDHETMKKMAKSKDDNELFFPDLVHYGLPPLPPK